MFMPVIVYKLIKFSEGKTLSEDGLVGIVMEGVNPHSYSASMYTFFFVLRRLFTGILLVVFHQYPFFQCSSLLVFSTVNFIYIVSEKPFEGTAQNRIEIFNEVCIMGCSHIFNIFLRGEGTISFINGTGWAFMATSISNILGNLANVIYSSFGDLSEWWVNRKRRQLMEKYIKERKENRDQITKEAPGVIRSFEFEKSIQEIVIIIKEWLP